MNKPEEQFKKDLAQVMAFKGVTYINIPDTKMLNKHNRALNREEKRPFDGLLIGSNGILCIEFKFGYNNLELHQEATGKEIEHLNGMYVVLRKIRRTIKGTLIDLYRAEDTNKKQLFQFEELDHFCNEIKKHFCL
jgi:hypothetical protein